MARYQHIVFDLAGTLIDSAPAILASFRDTFAQFGITPALAIDQSIIGPPLTYTLQHLAGNKDTALVTRLADQAIQMSAYAKKFSFIAVT